MISILKSVQAAVWSPPVLIFFGGVAVFLTVMLKGLQFRYLGHSLKCAFSRSASLSAGGKSIPGELSHFQALMTSLAAAIGTGNIAGVAIALSTGGMGALFWMWVMAIFGMVVKYCEAFLAVRYRVQNSKGEMSGGPMYFLSGGAGMKKMGAAYAFFGVWAAIGTGNMVQVHSVADAMDSLCSLPPWITGVILAILSGAVLFRGVLSIGKVVAWFVPAMACLYLLGGLAILLTHLDKLPEVLVMIISCAFNGQAAAGGFLGAGAAAAIQSGVSRGIFSNEAGLGTSSIASAAARTRDPGAQAMVAMTSAFLSTVIVCTMTGLVIGISGLLGQADPATGKLLNGAPLAMRAFGQGMPGGEYIVSFGLIFFAWSTILGWAYYGEKCAEYLTGVGTVHYYRLVYVLCIIPGSVLELESVWTLADIMNGLMMIPNLTGLLMLHQVVVRETKDYLLKIRDKSHDQCH